MSSVFTGSRWVYLNVFLGISKCYSLFVPIGFVFLLFHLLLDFFPENAVRGLTGYFPYFLLDVYKWQTVKSIPRLKFYELDLFLPTRENILGIGNVLFPYVAQRIFDLRQMKLNDVFQLILQSLGSLVCRKISRILFISPIFGNAQRIVNIPHTILWNGVDGIIICRSLDDYSVSFSDFRFLYSDLLTLACWRPIFLEELFRCVFQFSLHFRRCFHISLSFSAFS